MGIPSFRNRGCIDRAPYYQFPGHQSLGRQSGKESEDRITP